MGGSEGWSEGGGEQQVAEKFPGEKLSWLIREL